MRSFGGGSLLAWTALLWKGIEFMPGERSVEFRLRAGRRKAALPADAETAVIALKRWLRSYIGDTPLEMIASKARYSISAVSTAVGGAEVPSQQLVRAIADAVGAPTDQAFNLWWAAALAEFKKQNPPVLDNPIAFLARDLRKAMLKAGLSQTDALHRMARRCAQDEGFVVPMSRATLGRFLSGRSLPRHGQVEMLMSVLPLPSEEVQQLRNRYVTLAAAMRMVKSLRPKTELVARSEAR